MCQTIEAAAKQKAESFFAILKELKMDRMQREAEKAREKLERSFFFKFSKFFKLCLKASCHRFLLAYTWATCKRRRD